MHLMKFHCAKFNLSEPYVLCKLPYLIGCLLKVTVMCFRFKFGYIPLKIFKYFRFGTYTDKLDLVNIKVQNAVPGSLFVYYSVTPTLVVRDVPPYPILSEKSDLLAVLLVAIQSFCMRCIRT